MLDARCSILDTGCSMLDISWCAAQGTRRTAQGKGLK
jgi:hypothetical protein